jgi:hypothetical protein
MSETTLPPPTPEQIASVQGAQVVLDPASKAAEGAKGVYDNLDHNTLHRNAGYVEMGLDPHDPSNELTDPDPVPPADPPADPPASRANHERGAQHHDRGRADRT